MTRPSYDAEARAWRLEEAQKAALPTMPEEWRAAMARGEPMWDTVSLQREFDVLAFMAPYVVVRRRSDGRKGTLQFTHNPRWYFSWLADEG